MIDNRFLKARESRHMSNLQLSQITGLPSSMISHIEAGDRKPAFDTLRILAKSLHVSADYLLGLSDDMSWREF